MADRSGGRPVRNNGPGRLEELQDYYNRRAKEYEEIYRRDDPARKAELAALGEAMRSTLAGFDVLEIACGTGYWTAQLAGAARSILATDASREMLEIALSKRLPTTVSFAQADAFDLASVEGAYGGGLANFWFSHIPKARISDFLEGWHLRVGSGARVFISDNCYVPGVGGELVLVTGRPDTFKRRFLNDGTEHLVLKNYFDWEQLSSIFTPVSRNFSAHIGHFYWWISYEVP
jgi:SAM-dependent methyltransferase